MICSNTLGIRIFTMIDIHILRVKADEYFDLWCPYCDEVGKFGHQHWYEEVWCMKCKRRFSSWWKHHKWPKGFDIKTGELTDERGK